MELKGKEGKLIFCNSWRSWFVTNGNDRKHNLFLRAMTRDEK